MASEYRVIVTPKSQRDLNRIAPEAALQEALDLIEALRDDPYPPYARQLAERDNMWTFDVWSRSYRVAYQVSERQQRVIVKAAGPPRGRLPGERPLPKGPGLIPTVE